MTLFNWSSFLDVANEIKQKLASCATFSDLEYGYIRTGIGRAYYAAYWYAKIYLSTVDPLFKTTYKGPGSHELVVDKLKEQRGKHQGISTLLGSLKNQRVQADYYNDRLSVRDLDLALIRAENVIKQLQEIEDSKS